MKDKMNELNLRLAQLVDEFEFLDDWETKYRHIIDMGKKLPAIAPSQKIDSNKIRGCASQVWLVCEYSSETGKLRFYGESDSTLVQGLLGILIFIYSDAKPSDVMALSPEDVFTSLGLGEALTPSRANGLKSIAAKMVEYAHLNL